jgi:hypothetical protein
MRSPCTGFAMELREEFDCRFEVSQLPFPRTLDV